MHSVLLLEDFADTRAWLCEVLHTAFNPIEITEAATVAQARAQLANKTFDLALIDINLPDGNGIDVIRDINRDSPATYCVVATIFDDDDNIFTALQAGAQGYLLKEQPAEELIRNLQGLIRGEPPLSPAIARKILRHFQSSGQPSGQSSGQSSARSPAQSPQPANDLSEREKEILALVAKGLKRGDIGPLLGISPHTVATHVKTIYSKLNVTSRAEATVAALRLGLVKL
jgi:DNA-binding NarL/FixJ family response regulator